MMQFKMLQRLSRRLHVRIEGRKFNDAQAQYIEDTLMACEAITKRTSTLVLGISSSNILVMKAL